MDYTIKRGEMHTQTKRKKIVLTDTHTQRPEICEFHSTDSLTALTNQSLSLFLHSLNKRREKNISGALLHFLNFSTFFASTQT